MRNTEMDIDIDQYFKGERKAEKDVDTGVVDDAAKAAREAEQHLRTHRFDRGENGKAYKDFLTGYATVMREIAVAQAPGNNTF